MKAHSVKALAELRAVHSSVLLGMIHWPLLDKPVTLHALWLVQQPFRIDGDHAYGLGIADDKHGIVCRSACVDDIERAGRGWLRCDHRGDERGLGGRARPADQAWGRA